MDDNAYRPGMGHTQSCHERHLRSHQVFKLNYSRYLAEWHQIAA